MSYFNPRLSSSTKWTEVPEEFLAKVRKVFTDQFKAQATLGEFIVDGQIYPEEVLLRVGYVENGRLKQVNFEASMDLKGVAPKAFAASESDITADGETIGQAFSKRAEFDNAEFADEEAELSGEPSTLMDRLFSCIDIIGSLMEEYFEAGENIDNVDIPLFWKGYEFEGESIYLQYSTVNTKLEEEANRLLGLIGDALVNERLSDEDAMTAAQVDSDLALEVQKAIRSGVYRPEGSDANDPN
jgi:hypothetical protein